MLDVNKWIKDLDRTCPTSNTACTSMSAGSTGKSNAITELETITNGVKDKVAFFGYRFRWKSKTSRLYWIWWVNL